MAPGKLGGSLCEYRPQWQADSQAAKGQIQAIFRDDISVIATIISSMCLPFQFCFLLFNTL
jgi:hypothetical protein